MKTISYFAVLTAICCICMTGCQTKQENTQSSFDFYTMEVHCTNAEGHILDFFTRTLK